MTYGIIQKVLNSYIVNTHNYEYKATVNDINNLISRIERELIKSINETITKGFRCSCVDTDEIKIALIGDNNE